jgi:hypothetical protein
MINPIAHTGPELCNIFKSPDDGPIEENTPADSLPLLTAWLQKEFPNGAEVLFYAEDFCPPKSLLREEYMVYEAQGYFCGDIGELGGIKFASFGEGSSGQSAVTSMVALVPAGKAAEFTALCTPELRATWGQ